MHLFAAGRFDRIEDIEWAKYGSDDVASDYHHQVRDEAALQSFVLLKNDGKTLPLKAGIKVAVVGPQATGFGLFSDYCTVIRIASSSPPRNFAQTLKPRNLHAAYVVPETASPPVRPTMICPHTRARNVRTLRS